MRRDTENEAVKPVEGAPVQTEISTATEEQSLLQSFTALCPPEWKVQMGDPESVCVVIEVPRAMLDHMSYDVYFAYLKHDLCAGDAVMLLLDHIQGLGLSPQLTGYPSDTGDPYSCVVRHDKSGAFLFDVYGETRMEAVMRAFIAAKTPGDAS